MPAAIPCVNEDSGWLQDLQPAEVLVYVAHGAQPPLHPGVACGRLVSILAPQPAPDSSMMPFDSCNQATATVRLPLEGCGEGALLTQEVQVPCGWLRRVTHQPADDCIAADEPAVQVGLQRLAAA